MQCRVIRGASPQGGTPGFWLRSAAFSRARSCARELEPRGLDRGGELHPTGEFLALAVFCGHPPADRLGVGVDPQLDMCCLVAHRLPPPLARLPTPGVSRQQSVATTSILSIRVLRPREAPQDLAALSEKT